MKSSSCEVRRLLCESRLIALFVQALARERDLGMRIGDQETLERFILRARRIKAHSLVQSERISRYQKPSVNLVPSSGGYRIEFSFPDEERFESLVARVRPLLLSSESLHLPKVFKSLNKLVPPSAQTEEQKHVITNIQDQFNSLVGERNKGKAEGDCSSPDDEWLSDALLAETWLYKDLVHCDLKGEKRRGEKMPYEFRILSALSYYCRVASFSLSLLDLLREMSNSGQLILSDSVWSESVLLAEVQGVEQ